MSASQYMPGFVRAADRVEDSHSSAHRPVDRLVFDLVQKLPQCGFVAGIAIHRFMGERQTLGRHHQGNNNLHTIETFVTAAPMFAIAMSRRIALKVRTRPIVQQRGWLGQEFLEHARHATRGVLNRQVDLLAGNRMDIRGTVQVGSLGGNGGFYDYYVNVPVVKNDRKSIGAFMNLSLILSETANTRTMAARKISK
jgi:hypothetical protein